jgi:hypothetical protein
LALGDLHRLLVKAAAELERHHIADRGFAASPRASEAMDAACQAQQTAVDQLEAALRLLDRDEDYGWMGERAA